VTLGFTSHEPPAAIRTGSIRRRARPPIGLQVSSSAPADNYMVMIDGGTVTVTTADVT
jgi:hypothetical protein